LLVYFAMRVANQEFAPWRFQPLKRWLREEKLAASTVGLAQLTFLSLHLLVSILLCAPLLIWAGAIARTELTTVSVTFLLLIFYSLSYGVWGLVTLALWERKAENRQVLVRCFFFSVAIVSALIYLPLNPVAYLLSYLAREELASLTIGGLKWSATAVHFGFHLSLLGTGLATYLWALKRGGTVLIPEPEVLRAKFAALLRWEERKRREHVLLALGCYALVAAILMLPLSALWTPWISPWLLPIFFYLVGAPFLLLMDRWRSGSPARALARLDKALRLDERAITAWEILTRKQHLATELLVVREAGERLKAFEPKTIFPREVTWAAYVIAPLLALWLGVLWLDMGGQNEPPSRPSVPSAIAHKLREFARELQQLAKAEGLRESLNIGRELEKTADKRLEGATVDEGFKSELAAAAKKIQELAREEKTSLAAAATQEGLRDLRTELEVARDSLKFRDGVSDREISSELYERLAGLPQLKSAMEKGFPPGAGRGERELQSFLDKLEREASQELDRRALLETQQFLERMLKDGDAPGGESETRIAGREEHDSLGAGQKEQTKGSFPGTEPGTKEGTSELPQQPPGRAATHLKGLLGEGGSAGVMLKGRPSAGKPNLPQEEVVVSYQRRAEAELNSERVPEALKETIKNYFLSLGMGEGGK